MEMCIWEKSFFPELQFCRMPGLLEQLGEFFSSLLMGHVEKQDVVESEMPPNETMG